MRGQARPRLLPSSRVARPQQPRGSESDLQPPRHLQRARHPRRQLEAGLRWLLPPQAEQLRSRLYRPSRQQGQECHPQMPEASEPLPEKDPGPRPRYPRRPPQTGPLRHSAACAGATFPLALPLLPPNWKLLASFGKVGAWLSKSRQAPRQGLLGHVLPTQPDDWREAQRSPPLSLAPRSPLFFDSRLPRSARSLSPIPFGRC